MMPDNPKSCPFCGSTDIGPTSSSGCDADDNATVAAICWGCDAQGPAVLEVDRLPDYEAGPETTAASIAAWNRRAG